MDRRPYSTHARSLTLFVSVVSPRTEDETGRMSDGCHLIISPTLLSSGLDTSRQTAVTDCRFPTHFRYLIVRFVRKTQNTRRTSFFAYVVDWLSGSKMICGVEKCLVIRTCIWLRIGVSIEQCRKLSTNRKFLKS